ncbi:MAG: ABC transporter ATP-binding protein/permease [Bacilli bacterium]|nr:ABC transporter ATP-binding protein/permease [Bacilli bacterium]
MEKRKDATILECKKLRKLYQGEGGNTLALDSFSAAFPSSGLTAIVGKSGSGKSTLLCLLSLMEKPTSGQIYFEGKDINRFKAKERMRFLREDTAFVFQHYGLFEDKSVIENVMIPLKMNGDGGKKGREKALFYLSYLHLEEKENQCVSTLSGGEKQRVALARAMVKSPKVLFCDEPTGALDEKNGEEVMKLISSLSKTRLVVLVSHNTKLVEKYADRIIEMEDGVMKQDKTIRKVPPAYEDKKLHVFSSRYLSSFFLSHLKKDIKRDFLTFLSGAFGLLCILLSVSYMHGNEPALKRESKRSLEYLSAQIYKKEVISAGNSPLALTKTIKPSLEETNVFLSSISSYSIEEDLSYFLPRSPSYSIGENEFCDASFLPIYDITLNEYGSSFLSVGENGKEDIGVCYVNHLYEKAHRGIVGKRIELSLKIPFDYLSIHEEVELFYNFEVKGVLNEFPFLNTPKVYYSYPCLKKELQEIRLEKISEAFNGDISVYDCVKLNLGGCAKSEYLLYFHDPNEMDKAFELMVEEGDMVLSSSCYMGYSSLLTLSKAFEVCLWLLFAICLIGVIAITSMSFLCLFFSKRKETALLFSLGAKRKEVIALFSIESVFVCLLYVGVSFLSFPLLADLFNKLLSFHFGINGAVVLPTQLEILGFGIPFLLLVAGIAVIIAILSCALPVSFSIRKGLRKELRDE